MAIFTLRSLQCLPSYTKGWFQNLQILTLYIIKDVKAATTTEYEEKLNILTDALEGRRVFSFVEQESAALEI